MLRLIVDVINGMAGVDKTDTDSNDDGDDCAFNFLLRDSQR